MKEIFNSFKSYFLANKQHPAHTSTRRYLAMVGAKSFWKGRIGLALNGKTEAMIIFALAIGWKQLEWQCSPRILNAESLLIKKANFVKVSRPTYFQF